MLSDQGSVYFFKEVFERLRPCHQPALIEQINLVSGRCGGQFGFISSHASNVFGLAAFLVGIFKGRSVTKVILILWAVSVSISRVYLGVHFPFDVIFGACYGIIIGCSVTRIVKTQFSAI